MTKNDMKKIYRHFCPALILLAVFAAVLVSCSEDETDQPVITNVRLTEKDSTITGGEFGKMIAIQGSGLGGVTKVFFNDVEALLVPTFITSTNIICPIPNSPPTTINNKVTVMTASGQTATYDFAVVLPKPSILGVYNEFALSGSENAVIGNYFYVISKVLVGETQVEITKVTPTAIFFNMPENAETTTVTVVGEGGTTTSTFRLNETEGNMVNFDVPATGWGSDVCWGDSERINPDDSDIPVVSGRYARINQTNLAASGYQADWVFSTCYFEFGLSPGSHEDKMFKFEINIVKTWKAGYYRITIGTPEGSFLYKFKPWDTEALRTSGIKTSGWATVYIPLSEFHKIGTDDDGNEIILEPFVQIADASTITDLNVAFGNADKDASGKDAKTIPAHYVALDNFRIVDK
jgi:hypothetical protein